MTATLNTTLKYQGTTWIAKIVTIEETRLGIEDHGVFTAGLHITWEGSVTTIAGCVLDGKPLIPGGGRTATAFGMQFITEIIKVVTGDFGSWEDVQNKRILALWPLGTTVFNGYKCQGIANLSATKVMIFDQVKDHRGRGVDQ